MVGESVIFHLRAFINTRAAYETDPGILRKFTTVGQESVWSGVELGVDVGYKRCEWRDR
jgi:hypothetical protein